MVGFGENRAKLTQKRNYKLENLAKNGILISDTHVKLKYIQFFAVIEVFSDLLLLDFSLVLTQETISWNLSEFPWKTLYTIHST